jgi:cyclopropane-fatty-acyl-phospholipid synthase
MTTITAPLTTSTETAASLRFLEDLIGPTSLACVGFRLWDGTPWPEDEPRDATIVLKHPGALRAMFEAGGEKGLAEAFLGDDFDIEGNIESAFELADLLQQRGAESWLSALRNFRNLWRLPAARQGSLAPRFRSTTAPRHTPTTDRRAVSFHYDLSNDFYRLWLDRQMLYSCAYFARPDLTIDEAQRAKMEHICRKLRLRPGQRLLDIGCGWGGLAIFAARHRGVRVTGITLSERQAELARERVREAGLAHAVTIELKDYRELRPADAFDAIVSVGMSEHVGSRRLPEYFRRASELLKPAGVFLNHAIGESVQPRARIGPSFIEEYVFPDSEIPPIPVVLAAAESAGLEVRDVENLREHYALTLRQWVQRLEAAHARALGFVDEATYRVWRLYLAGSAHGFARAHLAIYQALLVKPDPAGNSRLPLTRADWYRPDGSPLLGTR